MFSFLLVLVCCTITYLFRTLGFECVQYIEIFTVILTLPTFLIDISKDKILKKYLLPLLCAYIFRLILLFFDVYGNSIFLLPSSGGDSWAYYNNSVLFSKGVQISYGKPFTTIMGFLERFIGTNKLFVQFFIVISSIITIIFVIKIVELLDLSFKTKYCCIFLLCVLPYYAILSSIFLRESFVSMFVSISLYYFIKWFILKKKKFFVCSLIFIFVASSLHSGVIGVAFGYVLVVLLYDQLNNIYRIMPKNIVFACILFCVMFYIYNKYPSVFFGKMENIKNISDIADNVSRGGSSYSQYVGDSSTLSNMIIYSFPRIFYFLFSPFPWQWRGISDIVSFFFNSFFYLFTIIKAFRVNRCDIKNKNLVIALIIILLCTIFVFAWGVTNSGTAIRHRDKLVAPFIVLLCILLDSEVGSLFHTSPNIF